MTSNSENSDPKILDQRGLFFDGVDDVLIIDPGTTKVINLPTKWAIFSWFNYSNSIPWIFGRYNDLNSELFSAYVSTSLAEASVTVDRVSLIVTSSGSANSNTWTQYGIKCVYDSTHFRTDCGLVVNMNEYTG